MLILFNDPNIYTIIKKDLTNKQCTFINNVRELFTRWKQQEFISLSLYRKIYSNDSA